ncbi:hypothetical protein HOY82DRAFT_597189 [Tuber indicum]|nr:hypothetical protein HOY82DRAFT_597189 [Tuber indicum]
MPCSRILSKLLGTAHASQDGCGARESLMEGSKKKPPKPFISSDQSRRNRILLAQRFSITFLALVLLVICLWTFSKKHPMSKWEQRSFNTLSLLLTAIASLGLGSLVGHLGSMLRWPLLARTVDSILGMSPPTGSFRLVWRHIRQRRISRTTLIVTAYLVTNVIGRLSVAIFGFAYNMTEKTGIEYPILATSWTSVSWTGQIFQNETVNTEKDEFESGEGKETAPQARPFMNLAWNGLHDYAKLPDWGHGKKSNFSIGDDISPYLLSDLQVSNTTLNLTRNTVEYSYNLKDFKEGYAILSNHTVHSAVNCSLIEVGKGRYWRWGNGNRTGPFSWGKDNGEVVSKILWVSNETEVRPYAAIHWMSVLDRLGGSSVYPQIYIKCENVAWECWPALTETDDDNESRQIQPHEKFFHPIDLYRLLTVGNGDYGYPVPVGIKDMIDALGSDRVYLSGFSGSLRGANADDGVQPHRSPKSLPYTLLSKIFKSPNETVWNGYRLWMAGLVARLPILAIMHANTVLPKFARSPYPNQTTGTAYLHTTLEVNWFRVVLTAISIIGGQILAILSVLSYCNGVYTRDDSHLATAELLKTVVNRFYDGKLMTGEELAASIDDVLKVPVSYGTRRGQDGGPRVVDLASGLDADFPPFPLKRRLWRNAG